MATLHYFNQYSDVGKLANHGADETLGRVIVREAQVV